MYDPSFHGRKHEWTISSAPFHASKRGLPFSSAPVSPTGTRLPGTGRCNLLETAEMRSRWARGGRRGAASERRFGGVAGRPGWFPAAGGRARGGGAALPAERPRSPAMVVPEGDRRVSVRREVGGPTLRQVMCRPGSRHCRAGLGGTDALPIPVDARSAATSGKMAVRKGGHKVFFEVRPCKSPARIIHEALLRRRIRPSFLRCACPYSSA